MAPPVGPPTPLQVPHVFVVPPEEDETPVWCCFDAALPIDQQIAQGEHLEPDIQIFDPTIDYEDDDFSPMDSVAMAHRNMETRSIVDALMSRNYNIDHTALDSDSDLEWDSENEHAPRALPPQPRPPRSESEPGNDSDVIEVVKVSRSKRAIDDNASPHRPAPPPPGVKPSTTFKARATRAFRSITGTFRSSKSRAAENLPPRPSSSMSCQLQQEDNRERQKETLPRPESRVSRRFSQLFTVSSVRSRSSLASYDEPPSPTVASSPSEPVASNGRRSSIYQESIPPETLSRAPSPIPSTSGKSSTRRFSKLNLQKMFSFSSTPEPTPPSMVSGRSTPTLKRKSSSLPSTCSESSAPQTPTSTEDIPVQLSNTTRSAIVYNEDGHSPQLDFGDFETGLGILQPTHSLLYRPSSFSSATTYSSSGATTTAPADGNVSFEMKLDSLHFDSLSFDADRFLVD